ncbi:MAG: hypothetical protein WD904_05235 [Dehalococcoidia bacterium]
MKHLLISGLTLGVALAMVALVGASAGTEASHNGNVVQVRIGDVTCNGGSADNAVTPVDVQVVQRYDAGLSTSQYQNEPCPNLGLSHQWEYNQGGPPNDQNHWTGTNEFGDVDCDDDVDSVDALFISRFDAGYNDPACGEYYSVNIDTGSYPAAPGGISLKTAWCPPYPC